MIALTTVNITKPDSNYGNAIISVRRKIAVLRTIHLKRENKKRLDSSLRIKPDYVRDLLTLKIDSKRDTSNISSIQKAIIMTILIMILTIYAYLIKLLAF